MHTSAKGAEGGHAVDAVVQHRRLAFHNPRNPALFYKQVLCARLDLGLIERSNLDVSQSEVAFPWAHNYFIAPQRLCTYHFSLVSLGGTRRLPHASC